MQKSMENITAGQGCLGFVTERANERGKRAGMTLAQ